MVRLSLQDQLRVVVYFDQGVSQCQIAAQLHCSHTAVQKVVRKYRSTGSVEDLPKSGRPQVLTAREKRIAVNLSKKDRFRPATSIRDDLETNYGTSVSVATIKEDPSKCWDARTYCQEKALPQQSQPKAKIAICSSAQQVIQVKKLVGLPPPALELLGRLS